MHATTHTGNERVSLREGGGIADISPMAKESEHRKLLHFRAHIDKFDDPGEHNGKPRQ